MKNYAAVLRGWQHSFSWHFRHYAIGSFIGVGLDILAMGMMQPNARLSVTRVESAQKASGLAGLG